MNLAKIVKLTLTPAASDEDLLFVKGKGTPGRSWLEKTDFGSYEKRAKNS